MLAVEDEARDVLSRHLWELRPEKVLDLHEPDHVVPLAVVADNAKLQGTSVLFHLRSSVAGSVCVASSSVRACGSDTLSRSRARAGLGTCHGHITRSSKLVQLETHAVGLVRRVA